MAEKEVVPTQPLIDFLKNYTNAESIDLGNGNKAIVLPTREGGKTIYDLKSFADKYLKNPERVTGKAIHANKESFVAHFNRFKIAGSSLFASADEKKPEITGIIDYAVDQSKPDWAQHLSVLQLVLDEKWDTWNGVEALSQSEFAGFLEENLADIQPAPDMKDPKNASLLAIQTMFSRAFTGQQEMLNLSRGIEINEGNKVVQKIDPQSGQKTIVFENEHKDAQGQPLKVPGMFLIHIPVFKDGPRYSLPVRLRYRLQNGNVIWGFSIYQADKAYKDAFNEVCTTVQKETETTMYVGTPE